MEAAMTNRDNPIADYPMVDMVIGAIADWVKSYRHATGLRDELAHCGADEVKAIASDLGLTTADLRELASKGPGGADLLTRMLMAMKVDPKVLSELDPRVTRDLQRLCTTCGAKRRCEHELAAGTAVKHMHEFCPNAVSLKTLFPNAMSFQTTVKPT
jgi:hypothetical protein